MAQLSNNLKIQSKESNLTPNIVCSNVIKPEATNNVPINSLLPTLSSFKHIAGDSRIGIVSVAINIDM
jgi:hypothetical protein